MTIPFHRAPRFLLLALPLLILLPREARSLSPDFEAGAGMLWYGANRLSNVFGRTPAALVSMSVPWAHGRRLFIETGCVWASGEDLTTGPTFELEPTRVRSIPLHLGIRTAGSRLLTSPAPYLDVLAGAGVVFVHSSEPLSDPENHEHFEVILELRPTFPIRPGLGLWIGGRATAGAQLQLKSNGFRNDMSDLRLQAGLAFSPR